MSYKELPSGKHSSESSPCRAGCGQGDMQKGTQHPRVLGRARAKWEELRGKLWSGRPSQAEEGVLRPGTVGYQLPMLTVWAPLGLGMASAPCVCRL